MEKSFRNLSKLFRHLANILDLATSEDHIQKMVAKFRLFCNKKSQVHIYCRPGLIKSKFSTTHFSGPIALLINMLEGFCSKMTL